MGKEENYRTFGEKIVIVVFQYFNIFCQLADMILKGYIYVNECYIKLDYIAGLYKFKTHNRLMIHA